MMKKVVMLNMLCTVMLCVFCVNHDKCLQDYLMNKKIKITFYLNFLFICIFLKFFFCKCVRKNISDTYSM